MKTNKTKKKRTASLPSLLTSAIIFAIVGYSTLKAQTATSYSDNTMPISGNNCVAFGVDALISNSGLNNTAIGIEALKTNTSAGDNTAVGASALRVNTGNYNTGVGANSLQDNTSGENNTGLGFHTLLSNQTGERNTAGGAGALSISDADDNTAFGTNCLATNTTGTSNTGLGSAADVSAGNLTNATAIGAGAIVNGNNKVRIGNTSMTLVEIQTGGTYGTGSDGRFKSNVRSEDVKGLEFITKLRPVAYNYEAKKYTEYVTKNMTQNAREAHLKQNFAVVEAIRHTGFIAQEVEKAAQEIGFDFDGIYKPQNETDNYALSYGLFVVPLVKAVQEQQQMIEELQKALATFKQQSDINTGVFKNDLALSGSAIDQNIPNPFTNETVVEYSLSSNVKTAYMAIYDLSGKQITTLPIDLKSNSITITSERLAAGIYIYTLVADGIATDTKRMIVAEK